MSQARFIIKDVSKNLVIRTLSHPKPFYFGILIFGKFEFGFGPPPGPVKIAILVKRHIFKNFDLLQKIALTWSISTQFISIIFKMSMYLVGKLSLECLIGAKIIRLQ